MLIECTLRRSCICEVIVAAVLVLCGGVSARGDEGMMTKEVEASIEKGLAYLARTQLRDGSWDIGGESEAKYPCAMTSFAGLALMAGGNTPTEGRYAVNVKRGVDYVVSCADPRTGLISRVDEEQRPMYGHGFGILFLSQAYGMEQDGIRQKRIRRVLERAIELTGRSQSKDGGWLYWPDSKSDEGSVTVTQIQGLRACRDAGIAVPREIIERACSYIEKSANADGGIRYRVSQEGGSRAPITAAAVAVMYNAGEYENPVALGALEFVKGKVSNGRAVNAFGSHKYYGWLYCSQAMYLSSEENWRMFFPQVRDELLRTQGKDGSWVGDNVGRTYGTSVGLLILQLEHRYLPILQR